MNILKSTVIPASQVDECMFGRMASLMKTVYGGTSDEKIRRDLSNKQYVLLLYDGNDALQGFSTIRLFDSEFRQRPVKILFSGDTVISEESRGHLTLMHDWWQFTFTIQRQHPGTDVYWMLISKGWKTYKFLPLFYKEFYPCRTADTPKDVQDFMNSLAEFLFPGETSNGLIIPHEPDFLKNAENDVSARRSQDPDVQFFLEKNPQFGRGNELVCLTRLAVDNLTRTGRRILHDLAD